MLKFFTSGTPRGENLKTCEVNTRTEQLLLELPPEKEGQGSGRLGEEQVWRIAPSSAPAGNVSPHWIRHAYGRTPSRGPKRVPAAFGRSEEGKQNPVEIDQSQGDNPLPLTPEMMRGSGAAS